MWAPVYKMFVAIRNNHLPHSLNDTVVTPQISVVSFCSRIALRYASKLEELESWVGAERFNSVLKTI